MSTRAASVYALGAAPDPATGGGGDDAPAQPAPGAAPLVVPAWLRGALEAGYARGAAAVAQAAAIADPLTFSRWALANFPARPPAAHDHAELRSMHQIAAARTPAQTKTAQWLAADGDRAVWNRVLREWQRTVGPAQAAWGAHLLQYAREVNKRVNDDAKARFGRERPYNADPSLTTVVSRPSASSKSYPSGHTARAFLDATIVSALMPARRREFLALAHQMAMARIYGGVHFPKDTVAGAWEGALVAGWVLTRSTRPTG